MLIPGVCFKDVLRRHGDATALKMDVEGEELKILDKYVTNLPRRFKAVVFEYSYSADEEVSHFKRVVSNCKKIFRHVHHCAAAARRPKHQDGAYIKLYNRDVIVHCWGRSSVTVGNLNQPSKNMCTKKHAPYHERPSYHDGAPDLRGPFTFDVWGRGHPQKGARCCPRVPTSKIIYFTQRDGLTPGPRAPRGTALPSFNLWSPPGYSGRSRNQL